MILQRIYRLLLPEEKKKGMWVAGASFLIAILDFIGLAALLPILYYLLDGNNNRQVAVIFCLLAASIVIIKGVLSTILTRYQNRFLLSLYKRLSFTLLSAYYQKGLLFIREQGSNRLGHDVNYRCFAFSQGMLFPLLRMIGDGLLILLVTLALLVYDWKTVAVLYLSFLPFMFMYLWGVRKRVRQYGELELEAKRKQNRVVSDTFRGYTELEVNGAFSSLQHSFLEGMDQVSSNRMKLNTILRIPLLLSELSIVIGLSLLVITGSGDVKVLVGIFAVSAFRLLPALRSILTGWTQIQNASSNLNVLEEGLSEYTETNSANEEALTFQEAIHVTGLSYAYPEQDNVLENFNCTIHKGEYVGFTGYSGVGKSTLFNLLLGLLQPTTGQILIDKFPLSSVSRPSWLRKVGYVPQEVYIFHGTLAENIVLGNPVINRTHIERILKEVCLDTWLSTLPEGLDTVLGENGSRLSGGQKQRIGIARAIYKQIDILLLDEATSALDNSTEKEVNETLYRLKSLYPQLTILSIAHRESSLAYCDRIIKLE